MPNSMNIAEVKHILENQGHACLDLSKRLHAEGAKLSSRDKELIRVAYYPVIAEQSIFLKTAFLADNIDALENSMFTIKEIFEFLKC